ncbi:MAG: PQQ-dependent sugar dehydrogenase [Actinomycetota bacterium]
MELLRRVSARLAALGLLILLAACGGDQRAAPVAAAATATPDPAVPTATPAPTATPTPLPTLPPATATPIPTPTPTPLPPLLGLDTEVVVSGLRQPVFVTGMPGTDLLLVIEREGVVRLIDDGAIVDEPFLDLRDRINSSSIEQGLLGLAFHPSFIDSGRFFAYWTQLDGDSRLAEFTLVDGRRGDPESMQVVLDVEQPAERHNAGMIHFGPDGHLFLSLGDGGSGGRTAQDTTNLLGTIVRLDVDGREPYEIPTDNPMGDEMWAYGLRNPWRFSIDHEERLLYVADVGQDTFEEINVVSVDEPGHNFGWINMEGSLCFSGSCNGDGLTPPVLEYSHDEGCSVTGGHVYRGADIPELVGHYFYGDWCSGIVRTFRHADGQALDQQDWTADLDEIGEVTSFGVDDAGNLYTANWDGEIHRIVAVR